MPEDDRVDLDNDQSDETATARNTSQQRATGRNGLIFSLLGLALAAAFGLMLIYQPLSLLGGVTTGSGSGESGQATTPRTPGAPLPSR
jgi:hypothetical protein